MNTTLLLILRILEAVGYLLGRESNQRLHPLEIVGALYQFPLSIYLLKASEQELVESHRALDDAKDRFNRRF